VDYVVVVNISGGVGRTTELAPTANRIDELDRELIRRLQLDGRQPSALLARELQLDQRTVRRRVDRLLDEGVIRIAAVADPRALGYQSMAMVCLTPDAATPPGEVYAELCAMPEVDYVTRTPGRHAMQAEVMCGSHADLLALLTEKFESNPRIRTFEVLLYLRLHYQRAWFSNTNHLSAKAGVRPISLDAVDHKMVSLLAEDGRETFANLADAIGVSESMARKRYRALTQRNAMRVVAIANPLHLGYLATSWVAITCNSEAGSHRIAEALTQIDEVTYVVLTAGRIDILAEVVCTSHEHLISVIDERVRTITGVGGTEVWPYLDLAYKPLLPL